RKDRGRLIRVPLPAASADDDRRARTGAAEIGIGPEDKAICLHTGEPSACPRVGHSPNARTKDDRGATTRIEFRILDCPEDIEDARRVVQRIVRLAGSSWRAGTIVAANAIERIAHLE